MLKGYIWYPKEQAAKSASVLSCYPLHIRDIYGNIYSGYYYCGKFYFGQMDVTDEVVEWMIPEYGENVRPN